jgi:hypothetical protein
LVFLVNLDPGAHGRRRSGRRRCSMPSQADCRSSVLAASIGEARRLNTARQNMTDTSPLADAHQAIGAYFCAFSHVEQELGESVRAVFNLQKNEASDAIVAVLGDFAKKASLVWAASKDAKDAENKDASAEWKARVEATIKNVFSCNNDRRLLAHSLLQPKADGSVDLVRLGVNSGRVTGRDGNTWSHDDFATKIQQLNKLTEELKSLNSELRTFKYTIPNLGLMNSNADFLMTRNMPLFLAEQQRTPGSLAPDDTTK